MPADRSNSRLSASLSNSEDAKQGRNSASLEHTKRRHLQRNENCNKRVCSSGYTGLNKPKQEGEDSCDVETMHASKSLERRKFRDREYFNDKISSRRSIHKHTADSHPEKSAGEALEMPHHERYPDIHGKYHRKIHVDYKRRRRSASPCSSLSAEESQERFHDSSKKPETSHFGRGGSRSRGRDSSSSSLVNSRSRKPPSKHPSDLSYGYRNGYQRQHRRGGRGKSSFDEGNLDKSEERNRSHSQGSRIDYQRRRKSSPEEERNHYHSRIAYSKGLNSRNGESPSYNSNNRFDSEKFEKTRSSSKDFFNTRDSHERSKFSAAHKHYRNEDERVLRYPKRGYDAHSQDCSHQMRPRDIENGERSSKHIKTIPFGPNCDKKEWDKYQDWLETRNDSRNRVDLDMRRIYVSSASLSPEVFRSANNANTFNRNELSKEEKRIEARWNAKIKSALQDKEFPVNTGTADEPSKAHEGRSYSKRHENHTIEPSISTNRMEGVDFIASDRYTGTRKGYIFQRGAHGVGYYRDSKGSKNFVISRVKDEDEKAKSKVDVSSDESEKLHRRRDKKNSIKSSYSREKSLPSRKKAKTAKRTHSASSSSDTRTDSDTDSSSDGEEDTRIVEKSRRRKSSKRENISSSRMKKHERSKRRRKSSKYEKRNRSKNSSEKRRIKHTRSSRKERRRQPSTSESETDSSKSSSDTASYKSCSSNKASTYPSYEANAERVGETVSATADFTIPDDPKGIPLQGASQLPNDNDADCLEDSDDEDATLGPQPSEIAKKLTNKIVDYGGALRPGEGEAIAQYVQEGKRIPRRGEVGLTAEEIETFEDLGYVMSGSRHRRMNAIRIRKENQVYSAEEQRALAMYNYEERSTREEVLIAELRDMLKKQNEVIFNETIDEQMRAKLQAPNPTEV